MNKIVYWFYERTKRNMEKEAEENGLKVVDRTKFDKRITTANRLSIGYTVLLLTIALYLIVKWVVK